MSSENERKGKDGLDNRESAIFLLNSRAVLTRLVCHELAESDGDFENHRCMTSLSVLFAWIQKAYPECIVVEPRATDALEQMSVPVDCLQLFQEIKDGSDVCAALWMLSFADTPYERSSDMSRVAECLSKYWAAHPKAVKSPPLSKHQLKGDE